MVEITKAYFIKEDAKENSYTAVIKETANGTWMLHILSFSQYFNETVAMIVQEIFAKHFPVIREEIINEICFVTKDGKILSWKKGTLASQILNALTT